MTAEEVIDRARAEGIRITAAESCTGGGLMAALTAVPGASDVFDRGFVTYSNEAKMEMLGVRRETLEAHGAVSEETAAEMAEGALKHANAQSAISITGIAGPGGSDFKPEGMVCFGLATQTGTHAETIQFGAIGRENVRNASIAEALRLLGETL